MISRSRLSGRKQMKIQRLLALGFLLFVSDRAVAREHLILQKSVTMAQKRAIGAWIDQANTTTNHNNANPLQVQTSTLLSSTQTQRALLLFDFSPVRAAGIKSATLALNFVTAPMPILGYNAQYFASRITNFWDPVFVSWNSHISGGQGNWTIAGGDFSSTNQATATVAAGAVTWDITAMTQLWYTSTPNYGILIQDSQENGLIFAHKGTFSSNADSTATNRPSLAMDFIQHIQGLTATAGNSMVTLNWSYPAAVGTVTTPTKGVVIVRTIGSPVPDAVLPADGTNPAVCSTIGGAGNVMVFNNNALATTFTDTGACPGLANGSPAFYKVFAFDQSGAVATIGYDTNGATSLDAPMALATPSATTPEAALWTVGTGAAALAAPGIIPTDKILAGTNNGQVFAAQVSDGTPAFPPIGVNAAVSVRPPLLASTDVVPSLGRNIAYVPDQLDAIYAIDTDTGEFVWQTVNLGTTIANTYTGSIAVQLKGTSNAGYTQAQDLVVTGQRLVGGSTTANSVVGLNGNDGSQRWISTGASSTASATGCGGNCNMDMITSTPFVDYGHNVIWITSFNNGGSGSAANAPDVWKFNSNATGPGSPVLAVVNLGSNISSSPTLTSQSDVLFVGLDTGILNAMDPVNTTAGVINTLAACPAPTDCITTDGAVKGAPLVLSDASPYKVVYATNTQLRAVSFNKSLNSFTALWQNTTSCANPSAPIGTSILTGKDAVTNATIPVFYLGCGNGKILELRVSDGTLNKTRTVNNTGTVGDIALDVQSPINKVIAGSTAGRITAFAIPF
jgi:hypothetical protein